MTDPGYSVLLVDTDPTVRARVANLLLPLGCKVYEAEDGDSALRILRENDIRVVLSELYLKTGEQECLVRAVRSVRALANTRTLAHTRHCNAPDREWAMRAGADAYLIQPTRPNRLRYVVARLASQKVTPDEGAATRAVITRRDSLDAALREMETGATEGTSSIVFSRDWWSSLEPGQQASYRRRAKKSRVSLRSDSLLSNRFVEIREAAHAGSARSTARPQSPYRS